MTMKRRNVKKWTKKVNNAEERYILEHCLINPIVLQKVIANSNLCHHASQEFDFAGYDKNEYSAMFAKDVMQLLAVLYNQGHSGFSIKYVLKLFNSLAKFEVLTPLTLKDDEWNNSSDVNVSNCQNKRYSSIFKEKDGTIVDIDAYTKMPTGTYHFNTKKWEENTSKICWSGRLYEHENNILTGRYFSKCAIILDKDDKYMPKPQITIPCIEIEVDEGNWIMCVAKNENRLKMLNKSYNIIWQTENKLKGVNVTDCEILSKL